MIDGVESGRDVKETDAEDSLMADDRHQFIVQRDKLGFSGWCLVKRDWLRLKMS